MDDAEIISAGKELERANGRLTDLQRQRDEIAIRLATYQSLIDQELEAIQIARARVAKTVSGVKA